MTFLHNILCITFQSEMRLFFRRAQIFPHPDYFLPKITRALHQTPSKTPSPPLWITFCQKFYLFSTCLPLCFPPGVAPHTPMWGGIWYTATVRSFRKGESCQNHRRNKYISLEISRSSSCIGSILGITAACCWRNVRTATRNKRAKITRVFGKTTSQPNRAMPALESHNASVGSGLDGLTRSH